MTSRIGSEAGHKGQRAGEKEKTEPRIPRPLPRKGFLLVEAMVASAILALGIVFLFRSFFSSLDAVQYASNRILAQIWLQGKMAQEREKFLALGEGACGDEAASFVLEGREFSWSRTLQILDENLFALTLGLSWQEGGRMRSVSYVTYLNQP